MRTYLRACLGVGLMLGCRAPRSSPPAEPAPADALQLFEKAAGTRVRFPDGGEILAETAATPQSRETGLMFRTRLDAEAGMLFFFAEDRALQFWMKNTFVELDMVFLGADRRITVIHEHVPSSRPDTPESAVARRSGTGRYVLELPAGGARRRKLKVGDRLEFEDPAPKK